MGSVASLQILAHVLLPLSGVLSGWEAALVFSYIRSLFSNDVLIELSENLISFKVFGSDVNFQTKPVISLEKKGNDETITAIGKVLSTPNVTTRYVNPFAHPRSFVGNFLLAEKILQHGMREIHKTRLRPSPRVVMHQLEKNEGGLTDIEDRVLRELAVGAGAREVIIYLGQRINVESESFNSIKDRV